MSITGEALLVSSGVTANPPPITCLLLPHLALTEWRELFGTLAKPLFSLTEAPLFFSQRA